MRWHTLPLTVGTLALLAGCSDQTTAIASGDAEREQIVERTLALQASVAATGFINAEQLRELEEIKEGIVEWQERTGRDDLSVSSSRPALDAISAAPVAPGTGTTTCKCPPVLAEYGHICFNVGKGYCRPGESIAWLCGYVCINVASPSRQRHRKRVDPIRSPMSALLRLSSLETPT